MRINFRIILINFVIVVAVLIAAGAGFSSIMMNVITSQQSNIILGAANDFIYIQNELDRENDELFDSFLENRGFFQVKNDAAIDYIFEVTTDSVILPEQVLFFQDCQIPAGRFTIEEFVQINPALIIKSRTSSNGRQYFYGYVYSGQLIGRISKRIKADLAVFDKNKILELSNLNANQEYYYILEGIYNQLKKKPDFELYGGDDVANYILATIYRIKAPTYSNKFINVLLFSRSTEAIKLRTNLQSILLLLGVSGVFLSFILTFLFTSKLRKQIQELSEITVFTKTGNFKARLDVQSTDELGDLAHAFNVMLIELEKKEKQKNEYTEFITLINKNPSLNEVASAVLHNIMQTGGFTSGRICVVDREHLQVIAIDGDAKKEFSESDILVLREVIEKKTDLLFAANRSEGNNTVEVKEQVLITPVIYNQKVIAIIKLVSVHTLDKEIFEYMNKIREQLAVGLMNAISLNKLEDLVHELRVLNEEYQIQNVLVSNQNERLKHLHEQLIEKAAELAIQKKKAEESTKLKSNFVATISHELRTPMNAILGLTELILNDATLSYKNRERLEVALRSAKRLITLINSILDLSKIESGRTDIRVERFTLNDLLAELQNSVGQLAESKRLTFRIEKPHDEEVMLTTDKHKLMQILINLCGNAIKFTEKGKVEVRTLLPSKDEILIEVEDTGIGMSSVEQSIIFDEFTQVDSSLSRRYEGSGLGLFISKKFTSILQGTLSLKSVPKKGSVFSLLIPRILTGYPVDEYVQSSQSILERTESNLTNLIEGQDSPSTAIEMQHAVHNLYAASYPGEILIVDDDPDTLFTLNELVKKSGCRTMLAKNGIECLEILETAIPDLILMDLMMPLLNGYETVKLIRGDGRFESIPVIAITAKPVDDNGEELMGAGFTGYIRKPFDSNALISKIKRIFKIKR